MSTIISLEQRRNIARALDCQNESNRSLTSGFCKRTPTQGEGHVMSALKGSVLATINPTGMDFDELMAVQAKERQQKRDAELFKEWKEATEALFKGSKRDPFDHALIFLQDMKGRRS